jgi:hypothetical protein
VRHVICLMTIAAYAWGLASLGLAEDQPAAKPAADKKVEAKAGGSAIADLRARIHRTMADLIEAQSAEKPDPARIESLTKELRQLRARLQSQAPVAAADPPRAWTCPWGGPGMGFGRGAGWGGRGPGAGPGRGAGYGAGAGRGPGAGRGFGPGAGLGLGPAGGPLVDEDNDGICDYYEIRHGMH